MYESVTGSQYSQESRLTLDTISDSILESVSYPVGSLFSCLDSSVTLLFVLLFLYVSETGSQYSVSSGESGLIVRVLFLWVGLREPLTSICISLEPEASVADSWLIFFSC